MKKGLLNVQFWHRDRKQMMDVVRLIANVQAIRTDDFDIMFSARWDTEHDTATIKEASRKFDVWTCKTTTKVSGWPLGCNYLWLESMKTIYGAIKQKKLPKYKWVLTLENDDCPLSRDWLDRLDCAFDDAGNLAVLGSIVPFPKPHVNGNCLFSTREDVMDFVLGIKRLPNVGWDYYLADRFRWLGWADIPEIRSIWGTKTAGEELINKFISEGVCMLHGVKDYSVIQWARHFLTGPRKTTGVSQHKTFSVS